MEHTESVRTVTAGGRMFTVRELTPVFESRDEREEERERIEKALYDIFSKYTDPAAQG